MTKTLKTAVPETEVNQKEIDRILAISGTAKLKRHQTIWMIHCLGLPNKKVAEICKTNQGHVGNVIKDYARNQQKVEAVKSLV